MRVGNHLGLPWGSLCRYQLSELPRGCLSIRQLAIAAKKLDSILPRNGREVSNSLRV